MDFYIPDAPDRVPDDPTGSMDTTVSMSSGKRGGAEGGGEPKRVRLRGKQPLADAMTDYVTRSAMMAARDQTDEALNQANEALHQPAPLTNDLTKQTEPQAKEAELASLAAKDVYG